MALVVCWELWDSGYDKLHLVHCLGLSQFGWLLLHLLKWAICNVVIFELHWAVNCSVTWTAMVQVEFIYSWKPKEVAVTLGLP